jgi:zinc transporter ZupT
VVSFSSFLFLLGSTLIAISSAAVGVWLTGISHGTRRMIPLGGTVLIGITLFGILPELAQKLGWTGGAASLTVGFCVLWFVDRYIHPVCPSCSHTHDHAGCSTALHGFAGPLMLAAAIHSFLDGWGIVASQQEGSERLVLAIVVGIGLHKVPEGLAFGAILRASLNSRLQAFSWCAAAETITLLGGVAEFLIAPHLGMLWVAFPMALVGGSFLFLGFHTVHGVLTRQTSTVSVQRAIDE